MLWTIRQRHGGNWRPDRNIFDSVAFDASADGSIIVGGGFSASGQVAFRWTSSTGMVGLGDLPGGFVQSAAYSVSADGSVIVGVGIVGFESNNLRAALWNSSGALQIGDFLTANGVSSVAGWTLTVAYGVSADGRTIVGTGINPNGQPEGWIATVPEPSGLVLASLAALSLCAAARRRTRNCSPFAGES